MHDKVTAVIPGYNCSDLTARCLDHLAAHAPNISVVYVDDGSADEEFASVVTHLEQSGLSHKIIRNSVNSGFSHAVNCGLQVVENHPLVLNNDCFVGPTCIDQMYATLQKYPRVAAVVPSTDGPNLSGMSKTPERLRRFKQALIASHNGASVEEVAALVREAGHQVVKRLRQPALPFFCALLRKEAVDVVGVLNEKEYPAGLGADDEWCLRAVDSGWETAIDFGAFASHAGRTTFIRMNIDRNKLHREAHRTLQAARRTRTNHYRIKGTAETLQHLGKCMTEHSRLFFTRFGDGEINHATGKRNKTQAPHPLLQVEMAEAFCIQDPQYLIGLTGQYPVEPGMVDGLFAPFKNATQLSNRLQTQVGLPLDTLYENPVVFHYMSVFQHEQLLQFFDEHVLHRSKMFIGSVDQSDAEKIVGPITKYVSTPPSNAYHAIDEWWPEVLRGLPEVDMVIPTVGPASKVVNKRLFEMGVDVHGLDIGSLFDAVSVRVVKYMGRTTKQHDSRTWLRMARGPVQEFISKLEHARAGGKRSDIGQRATFR